MRPTSLQTGASASAIQHHYDVGNDFYRLWLDPTMNYSCALWENGDTLESAQKRKMEYHAREARTTGVDRVLDVGCGWGGMMRHLIECHEVKHVVGLTLSNAQAEFVAAMSSNQLTVRNEGWEQHKPVKPYDAIISIGAMEHFARLNMSAADRIQNYKSFFERCREVLKPGGWMSLQTFAHGSTRNWNTARHSAATQFLSTEIFPETDPPRLVEVVEAIDSVFELVRLRNDRKHYGLTCRSWLNNLRANKESATKLVGDEVIARYQRYLQLSIVGFETGKLDLYRITLRPIQPRQRRINVIPLEMQPLA